MATLASRLAILDIVTLSGISNTLENKCSENKSNLNKDESGTERKPCSLPHQAGSEYSTRKPFFNRCLFCGRPRFDAVKHG